VWHAAFSGHERENGLQISSLVHYTIAPATPLPPPVDTLLPPPAALAPPVAAPPLSAPTQPLPAPVEPPTVAAPPQQPVVAVSLPTRYQYPAAFLMPLAFLAAAVFLFRLFTGDPTPVSVRP
jgi:hypothetical protein